MEEFFTGRVVHHKVFGTGRIVHTEGDRIVVNFISSGVKYFSETEADTELYDPPVEPAQVKKEEGVDIDMLKEMLREVLREEGLTGVTRMAEKWDGGEVVLKPGKPGLQEKAVPIDVFFHKIVMIRNQLRVLEQNINASDKLSDSDKVNLQQYVTRCYGSLTTFNVLFSEKKDMFTGSKKD